MPRIYRMKQMKDSNLPDIQRNDSDESKWAEFLTEDVIKAFCTQFRVGREEAKAKLIEGFKKEELIDPRHVALKAMKGIRLLSPKMAGLDNRVKDCMREIEIFLSQISDVQEQLKEQRHTFKTAIELMEKNTVPRGFWNKIKWLMKN